MSLLSFVYLFVDAILFVIDILLIFKCLLRMIIKKNRKEVAVRRLFYVAV